MLLICAIGVFVGWVKVLILYFFTMTIDNIIFFLEEGRGRGISQFKKIIKILSLGWKQK